MSVRTPAPRGPLAPTVKLRHRDPMRCGSCGTQWSSRWYEITEWPSPLCADCNCPCKRRGVDHRRCEDDGRLLWTYRRSTETTLATRPVDGHDGQLRLPL